MCMISSCFCSSSALLRSYSMQVCRSSVGLPQSGQFILLSPMAHRAIRPIDLEILVMFLSQSTIAEELGHTVQ